MIRLLQNAHDKSIWDARFFVVARILLVFSFDDYCGRDGVIQDMLQCKLIVVVVIVVFIAIVIFGGI